MRTIIIQAIVFTWILATIVLLVCENNLDSWKGISLFITLKAIAFLNVYAMASAEKRFKIFRYIMTKEEK